MNEKFDVNLVNKEIGVMARTKRADAKKTTREYVQIMKKNIEAALAAGYTYEALAKKLTESGLKISAITLKQYLRTQKPVSSIHDKQEGQEISSSSIQDTEV